MSDQVVGGSAALMIYTRGDTYIRDKEGVYGQVGTLALPGLLFETVERLNKVALAGGRTYICKLETASKANVVGRNGKERDRQQIRPLRHGKMVPPKDPKTPGLVEAAILIHAANGPNQLEGCIAPGFVEGNRLTYSVESAEIVWEMCGGTNGRECQLKVVGEMKKLAQLKPHGK